MALQEQQCQLQTKQQASLLQQRSAAVR